jgi:excisionase family DNA binding protein
MDNTYISTREVADLLAVTDTTVKRWTNSGRLKCAKTLGGHRKYILSDIEKFAEENNISITGVTTPLRKDQREKLGFAMYSKNMDMAVEIIMEESLQGDREGMFESLMYLVKNRMKFADIIDNIIKPAMEKVGYLWETKKLGVEQEHLASDTIKTALSRLVVYFPHQKEKNIKVLLACSEEETHDLGLQSLAYELERGGYRIHYLGANTPFKSLIKAAKTEKPDYIMLSASAPSISETDFIKGFKNIAKTAKGINAKLVAGGWYFKKSDKNTVNCDLVADSIKEGISFIKKNNKQ